MSYSSSVKQKRWRESHREAYNAYMRKYRQLHPIVRTDEVRAKERARRNRHLDVFRANGRNKYSHNKRVSIGNALVALGYTIDDKHLQWELQGERCGRCWCSLQFFESKFDHDHVTLVVRGVVCQSCNCLIDENPNQLTSVYLDRGMSGLQHPLLLSMPENNRPLDEGVRY
jgi:hypothetical protein